MKRLLLLVALTACSLEPPYSQPPPAVPTSWPAGSPALAAEERALPAIDYRAIFRDPALQALIARALAANQDVRAALANVQVARGQYRTERAAQFPEVGASAGVTASDRGTAQNGGLNGGTDVDGDGVPDGGTGGGTGAGGNAAGGRRNVYNVQLGLAAFELDLFGRLRSLSNAALDQYLATEAAVRTARLTVVAETASAYLTLAADRSLQAIAADTAASAQRTVELTRLRLEGGVAPRTELRQAETVLAQAQADLADLAAQVAADRNALVLLVGGPVAEAELPRGIEAVDGLLAELPAGLDSRVLLRRPDVVEAEYRLRAANARIGAARAAFFPTISLTAAAGLTSTALSRLFTGGAFTWSAGPAIDLPIFDGGRRRGDLTATRGQFDLALAQWQRAVQVAFREVADALARRANVEAQVAAQARLEAAARDTLTLEEARYREGIAPYLNTLDAQRTFYAARRALAQVRLVRADNLVELYRSLGGDQLTEVVARPAGRRVERAAGG